MDSRQRGYPPGMADRPRDPRMTRATYGDPRGGFQAPTGVAAAAAIGIGYVFGGVDGALAALGAVFALGLAWWALRVRRR